MVRYSDEIIENIRQSSDIVNIISQYVALKRKGRNYFGICPFHNEKSPSFAVSPDRQIFHCFGCNAGGNVYSFLMKIEGIGFKEAVEQLAERANIQLPRLENTVDSEKEELKEKVLKINEYAAEYYHQNLYKPGSKIAQEYIKQRKLNNDALKNYRLGYSGKFDELYQELKRQNFKEKEILESGLVRKNDKGTYYDFYRERLIIPICDVRGRVIAFGGRILIKDDKQPKYINSPENIVYSKGRHLFGLNVAKKGDIKKLLIVEGYMDVISLHQRGVTNVVGALGTALTEQQGWLLRRSSEQIILGFDSDSAGQNAIERSIGILQNMGCDMRVLQMEGAKDPDEYILKYGTAKFQKLIDDAISLVEYKVKILKNKLNLENTVDRIKFLNEIAKILSKVDNSIEREVYISKIAKDYNISQEAIYAEVNKIIYANTKGEKNLNKTKPVIKPRETQMLETENIPEEIKKRENTIISILLDTENKLYEIIKENIQIEDFKYLLNREIVSKVYEEYEKGNFNVNSIIDSLSEELQNQITGIMAYDFGIEDKAKAIKDIIKIYEKERLNIRKLEIINLLEQEQEEEEKKKLEKELYEIIIKIAKQ
ncbi:MAG: DNA primase [Clostridia bacterium]|nr:DNA primase [Clostridia bacterium]